MSVDVQPGRCDASIKKSVQFVLVSGIMAQSTFLIDHIQILE